MTKKFSHRRTLYFELDQNSWHRRTFTWCQKNMLVRSAWTGPPAPARKLALAGKPTWPRFASLLYEKNTSGKDIRRTPDVKLRFVGFKRFVGFNFSQIQLLIVKVRCCLCSVILIRSSWFGQVNNPRNLIPLILRQICHVVFSIWTVFEISWHF